MTQSNPSLTSELPELPAYEEIYDYDTSLLQDKLESVREAQKIIRIVLKNFEGDLDEKEDLFEYQDTCDTLLDMIVLEIDERGILDDFGKQFQLENFSWNQVILQDSQTHELKGPSEFKVDYR